MRPFRPGKAACAGVTDHTTAAAQTITATKRRITSAFLVHIARPVSRRRAVRAGPHVAAQISPEGTPSDLSLSREAASCEGKISEAGLIVRLSRESGRTLPPPPGGNNCSGLWLTAERLRYRPSALPASLAQLERWSRSGRTS